ncbi:hypothetical protein COU76_06025 [Candidatus Peregrinibacteria bacterium CG10_big_fil_rev_8_21_14_0_10_49_10]|nr:MAG: hypothetical protein COU76_06025 [Candidatus Peregrinibacteria bacterium CG10_big_fil_rev_8_21_14_0_10_49_10]
MHNALIRKFLSLMLGMGLLAPAFAFAAPDMPMHATEELQMSCSQLRKLSSEEKADIVEEIGHNMDANALRPIFRCMFPGKVKRVAVVTESDLKINPKDREFLYYIPQTGQFFVTCKSMNTIAYVVDSVEAGGNKRDWKSYFQSNRSMFSEAAQMAKDMVKEMMEMSQ